MASDKFEAIIEQIPRDFADPEADYQAVRETMAPFHNHPLLTDLQVDTRDVGGVDCGWYWQKHNAEEPYIALHYHGGAFVSCPLDVYHFYGETIARELDLRVVMPDFRLAPENPYPAAPDDCFNAYRGLLEQGIRPENIVVLGESCGGGLGLGALLQARDQGLPMPACFISVTGWFDLSVTDAPPGRDPFLTPEWVQNRGREFTAGKVGLDDPRVSPCYAELSGLPHLYLQVGQFDTMAGSALRLAQRATLAGVQVTMESWPEMIQGWHGLVNAGVPEAKSAWSDIKRFVDWKLQRTEA